MLIGKILLLVAAVAFANWGKIKKQKQNLNEAIVPNDNTSYKSYNANFSLTVDQQMEIAEDQTSPSQRRNSRETSLSYKLKLMFFVIN